MLGCLLLSGAAGLIYELIWVRLLALGFGSTSLSFSAVLAVYFGGLALGAVLAGRWALRTARPLRVYGLIELGIGALALAIGPLFGWVESGFAAIDSGAGWSGLMLRLGVSAIILLGPTMLMGATLPFVTRAFVTHDEQVASGTASVYGVNTLGAFLGAYLVSFALLPNLGVQGSTWVGVGLNLVAGVIALGLSGAPVPLPEPEQKAEASAMSKLDVVAVGLAFLGGFSAICFQVVWARLFSMMQGSTVYAVGSVLIAVLAGIGLGSLLVAGVGGRGRAKGAFVLAQLIALGSTWLLGTLLQESAYGLVAVGAFTSGLALVHLQLAIVAGLLIVPCLAFGASLPLLVASVESHASTASRSLARIYSGNTAGSILGSVIAGFLLLPTVGSIATYYLGLAMVALTGAIGAVFFLERPLARLGSLALCGVLFVTWEGEDALRTQSAVLGGQNLSPAAYLKSLQTFEKRVAYATEGRSANVVVTNGERRGLSLNGLGQGSYGPGVPHHNLESLLVALVPLTHRVEPERALVVGLGAGATVDVLAGLSKAEIDVIELEAEVVAGLEHIYPEADNPLRNPRVHLHVDDARRFLASNRAREGARYDIITSMPAHPWVAVNIFTREFFELARDNLAETGVFSTWFGIQRMDQVALDGLVRAFGQAFPYYIAYFIEGTGALYMVGSPSPLEADPEVLGKFRAHPIVEAQVAIDSDAFIAARIAGSGSPEGETGDGPVNTDDSALVEFRAAATSTTSGRPSQAPYEKAGLRPELLSDTQPETLLEIFEVLLATPGGRPGRGRARLDAIAPALENLGSRVSESLRHYVEGRVQLAKGKREPARELLAKVKDGELGRRAARFIVATWPVGSAERAEALRQIPSDGRSWVQQVEELGPDAVEWPRVQPARASDPMGWLTWLAFSETASTAVGPDIRAQLGVALREAAAMRAPKVLAGLAEAARRRGWGPEARLLEGRTGKARAAAGQRLAGKADRAYRAKKCDEAMEAVREAYEIAGPSFPLAKFQLMCGTQTSNRAWVNEAVAAFRLLGQTEAQVQNLVKRAALGEMEVPEKAEDPSEDMDEGAVTPPE